MPDIRELMKAKHMSALEVCYVLLEHSIDLFHVRLSRAPLYRTCMPQSQSLSSAQVIHLIFCSDKQRSAVERLQQVCKEAMAAAPVLQPQTDLKAFAATAGKIEALLTLTALLEREYVELRLGDELTLLSPARYLHKRMCFDQLRYDAAPDKLDELERLWNQSFHDPQTVSFAFLLQQEG